MHNDFFLEPVTAGTHTPLTCYLAAVLALYETLHSS